MKYYLLYPDGFDEDVCIFFYSSKKKLITAIKEYLSWSKYIKNQNTIPDYKDEEELLVDLLKNPGMVFGNGSCEMFSGPAWLQWGEVK